MIQVTSVYRGRRTQERPIPTGFYEEDDPALFGLADFLVETGRAKQLGAIATFPSQVLEVAEGMVGIHPTIADRDEYVAQLEETILQQEIRITDLETLVATLEKIAPLKAQGGEVVSEPPLTGEDSAPPDGPAEEPPASDKPKGKK